MRGKSRLETIFMAALVLFMIGLTGCRTPKNVTYFQDVTETVLPIPPGNEAKIEPYDKLSIIVKAKETGVSNLFNKTLPHDRIGDGHSDYFVSKEGTIDFPILGELKVEGMTRTELAAFIKGEIIGKGYVKDVVVTVEFLNLGYSVLGEVNHAGRFGLAKEEMTIVEAIALAGDITLQGKRENIKVIRKEKDGAHTYTVDLTNYAELTKSPAYYLKQDDIIYVEPNNIRKRQTTINGNNVLNLSFWVSVASLLTSMTVLIVK